jgi:hypothetical protein
VDGRDREEDWGLRELERCTVGPLVGLSKGGGLNDISMMLNRHEGHLDFTGFGLHWFALLVLQEIFIFLAGRNGSLIGKETACIRSRCIIASQECAYPMSRCVVLS